MNLKIYGGSSKGENLCLSCKFAIRIRGFAEGQEIIRCNGIPGERNPALRVPFPVAECTEYMNTGTIHKAELEKIAVVLDGTHTRVRGFRE